MDLTLGVIEALTKNQQDLKERAYAVYVGELLYQYVGLAYEDYSGVIVKIKETLESLANTKATFEAILINFDDECEKIKDKMIKDVLAKKHFIKTPKIKRDLEAAKHGVLPASLQEAYENKIEQYKMLCTSRVHEAENIIKNLSPKIGHFERLMHIRNRLMTLLDKVKDYIDDLIPDKDLNASKDILYIIYQKEKGLKDDVTIISEKAPNLDNILPIVKTMEFKNSYIISEMIEIKDIILDTGFNDLILEQAQRKFGETIKKPESEEDTLKPLK